MADRYQQFVNSGLGARLADMMGLPRPAALRRYQVGQPLLEGPLLLGGDGRLADEAHKVLIELGVGVHTELAAEGSEAPRYGALVFDASGITSSDGLVALFEFFNGSIRRLGPSGRVLVLGTTPALLPDAAARAAQRSLEGFARSVAKELRAGGTAQLLEVAPGAEAGMAAPLRFLLSSRSAYVSGQRVTVGPATDHAPRPPADVAQPLAGKVALVTGAARGIGAAIAEVLSRDGASVVCLDVPAAGEALARTANKVGGTALQVDITAGDAPRLIVEHLAGRHGGVDIVVHNAGITRDKTLAGMDAERWNAVLNVNLRAIERIDEQVLASGVLRERGRIVCVSSMSGIAGNRGQTNYATSKAGVIGHVEALSAGLAATGATINAVAPGFIETEMTKAIPFATREIGRRLSSLGQGGLPVDVAETIGFFAWPDSTWVNSNTLRVCGQNMIGA